MAVASNSWAAPCSGLETINDSMKMTHILLRYQRGDAAMTQFIKPTAHYGKK